MIRLPDTDVLIRYLQGRPLAVEYLERAGAEWLISAFSVGELFAQARNAEEHEALDRFVSAFEVAPLTGEITRQAGLLRRRYGPSHGTRLSDAMIAATVLETDATLVTFDTRPFPMLTKVEIPSRGLG